MEKEDESLIERVRAVFENSKFDFVTQNVFFRFTEDKEDDYEVDVVAIQDDILILIECKSGQFRKSRTEFKRINENIEEIKNKNIVEIRTNGKPKLTKKRLQYITKVFCGFVLSNENTYNNQKNNFEKNKLLVWNDGALKYFEKVSETIGKLTQYEILYREFKVPEKGGTTPVDAIWFKQGPQKIYLFSTTPELLLQIGYVSRRSSKRDEGYQRIINSNRLSLLTKFIRESHNLLMPNPVIVAFDRKIIRKLEYTDGQLMLPNIHCCAWIIDGQHRIIAFRDIDFSKTKFRKSRFTIPVVAFDDLPIVDQSETFVTINYYQKKIESLLIYELAATFKFPKNELVWPSMLTMHLNENGKLKGVLKVSELDEKKQMRTTSFVRTILNELLGHNPNTGLYDGPLYKIHQFNKNAKVTTTGNQKAFETHSDILQRYFNTVMSFVKPKKDADWKKTAKDRGFFKSSTIQAFLLVLTTVLRSERKKQIDFQKLLKPLSKINFNQGKYGRFERGFGAVNGITQELLKDINYSARTNYHYIPIGQIRKKVEKERAS